MIADDFLQTAYRILLHPYSLFNVSVSIPPLYKCKLEVYRTNGFPDRVYLTDSFSSASASPTVLISSTFWGSNVMSNSSSTPIMIWYTSSESAPRSSIKVVFSSISFGSTFKTEAITCFSFSNSMLKPSFV